MKITKPKVFLASAALVVAGVGTGVAVAAIPNSSTGVVTACRVTGDAGNVRIIDKQGGASCHSYETELSWDTTPGISDRSIVTDTVSVPASSSRMATATASCPSGKKAVGGGYYAADGDIDHQGRNLTVFQNYPVDGSSSEWKVRAYNSNSYATDITAYAVCVAE